MRLFGAANLLRFVSETLRSHAKSDAQQVKRTDDSGCQCDVRRLRPDSPANGNASIIAWRLSPPIWQYGIRVGGCRDLVPGRRPRTAATFQTTQAEIAETTVAGAGGFEPQDGGFEKRPKLWGRFLKIPNPSLWGSGNTKCRGRDAALFRLRIVAGIRERPRSFAKSTV